jgi:hypothetical protein
MSLFAIFAILVICWAVLASIGVWLEDRGVQDIDDMLESMAVVRQLCLLGAAFIAVVAVFT